MLLGHRVIRDHKDHRVIRDHKDHRVIRDHKDHRVSRDHKVPRGRKARLERQDQKDLQAPKAPLVLRVQLERQDQKDLQDLQDQEETLLTFSLAILPEATLRTVELAYLGSLQDVNRNMGMIVVCVRLKSL
jgi:hypothetical protein